MRSPTSQPGKDSSSQEPKAPEIGHFPDAEEQAFIESFESEF
jgi:hypothetical protein